MSPEQDDLPQPDSTDPELAEVMRQAEQAVDDVRSHKGSDEEDDEVLDEIEIDNSEELAEAQAEAAALKDKWLRAVADLENYKKRVKRDIDDAVHRAVQGLLGDFLSVGDNLERALSVAPDDADEKLAPLIKGIDMVKQEFFTGLGKHGIKPIESVGRPFDPNVHDALQQMDSPDYAPGTVMMEYEKGYRRGEKLLRPARVIVAGPGSTGIPPEDGASESGDASEAN